MQKLKKLVRDDNGSGLIEFFAAATSFFLLLFGVIEFSMAVYAGSTVAYDAQQGARYAMVRGEDWTSSCASATSQACYASAADVQTYVLTLPSPGPGFAASDITMTQMTTTAAGTTCAKTGYQGCQVKVNVAYSFSLQIPFITAVSIPLSSTSIVTIQD